MAGLFLVLPLVVTAQGKPTIYYFYGTGCPHCERVDAYFTANRLYELYPIEKREVYFNRENARLYTELLDKKGIPLDKRGVPAVFLGETVLMGDRPIIEGFIKAADAYLQQEGKLESQTTPTPASKTGLTLVALFLGAMIDAINPCEFAVLILLMSTILASGNAMKALQAGLAFSTSIFISYFLMGLGLYKALGVGNLSGSLFFLFGWLAVILGVLNIKDYFWYGKGFLMEVPVSWRPRMKGLIASVVRPRGAFMVGFLVSLFLLPCTSGPYIVVLGMLAKNVFDAQALLYLFLYNLVFISPMVFITFAVYKGFDPAKAETIRQKKLRLLHLVAGIVLVAMGVVILLGWFS